MADLRESVKACARSLRTSGLGPAEMILAMKVCARAGNKRYPPQLNEHDLSNVDFLMDLIIKWSIMEYYSEA